SLRVQLERRRSDWTHGLEQLKQYTESLEKDQLKMASNMRRSRTEILHLSVRLQEQEHHKLLLREELDQLRTEQDRRDAGTQTEQPQVDDENSSPEWDRVYPLLDSPSEEESTDFEMYIQEDDEKQHPLSLPLSPLPHPPAAAAEEVNDGMEELQEDLSKLQGLQETRCGEDGEQESIPGKSQEGPPADIPAGPPEGITDTGTCDILLDENGIEGHAEPQQEEARFPECSGPDDTHEQAVCCSASLSHPHHQCAGESSLSLEYSNMSVTAVAFKRKHSAMYHPVVGSWL
ncbi:inositol 1,4,5-triphosphate receptor associated 2 isoform X1, partial [Tachysurus ichikawai]